MLRSLNGNGSSASLSFGMERKLDARADVGDVRDFIYRPTLSGLASGIDARESADWWADGRIRDQGTTSNCTAQALAGIVDHLRARDRMVNAPSGSSLAAEFRKPWASEKMLYNIARFHDEFPGENYKGSSIRGALKGFYFNGACSRQAAKELADDEWHMTRAILKSARRVQLGAYYRVRAHLSDVHAALNEAGLVLASAVVHEGWATDGGKILFNNESAGKDMLHAFILIGYTQHGFLVQNSWGTEWGDNGVSLWTYEDWSVNVIDQWVLRLAVPVIGSSETGNPQTAANSRFRLGRASYEEFGQRTITPATRFDVLGHVASLSRGRLDRYGPYHVDQATLEETARLIQNSPDYKHVLIHFMGLQRHETATMSALRDAIPVFKKNGIYPFFVTVENDLSSAVHDMVEAEVSFANRIVGETESSEKDRRIEARISGAALRIVEEIQRSSMAVFYGKDLDQPAEGVEVLNSLFDALNARYVAGDVSFHFSAHGFGCRLLATLIKRFNLLKHRPILSSVSLLSPMISARVVLESFCDRLVHPRDLPLNRKAKCDETAIEHLDIYWQDQAAVLCDRPMHGYAGNWPQLWSQVLAIACQREAQTGERLSPGDPQFEEMYDADPLVALGDRDQPEMESLGIKTHAKDAMHRDFDLRPVVLDTLLTRILGREPTMSFANAYPDQDSLLQDWCDPFGKAPSSSANLLASRRLPSSRQIW
ncbi:papain like protease [Primorskyibacter sedentarius]|uniref:Papain like protease n=1 Tax=Primorskyibacter sedentarius TaxID=745311 RepID=A0A4R3J370_9RHOB|nr:C1 family peptidase [Primorskyibacter sedentarius]TCS60279.1 papain like protease [Primorskyibacter sedentarius]